MPYLSPTGRLSLASALLTIGVLSGASCTDATQPTGSRSAATTHEHSSFVPVTSSAHTLDDDFVTLARQIPGFGGLYFDTTGVAQMYLTDTSTAEAAIPVIDTYLSTHVVGASAHPQVHVRRGQFNYVELEGAFQFLTRSLTSRGITSRDIDETKNRIVIGTLDSAALKRVSADVGALPGLPEAMVQVTILPPVVVQSTLTDAIVPREGGIQIENAAGSICTMSFSARMREATTGAIDSDHFFVTASHCTDVFGAVDSTRFGQPLSTTPIGFEVDDWPLFTSATEPTCPTGRNCRWSDAALIQYNSGIRDTSGYIAQTSGSGSTIVGRWRVVSTQPALVGSSVLKVGRTTNTTSGTVTGTCLTVTQYEDFGSGPVDTGRDMLCQDQANFSSGPGDSGAPVFGVVTGNDATLYGVFWGTGLSVYGDTTSTVRATFAPWDGIASDIGNSYNDRKGTFNWQLTTLYPFQ